jgi:hypothetical protein
MFLKIAQMGHDHKVPVLQHILIKSLQLHRQGLYTNLMWFTSSVNPLGRLKSLGFGNIISVTTFECHICMKCVNMCTVQLYKGCVSPLLVRCQSFPGFY